MVEYCRRLTESWVFQWFIVAVIIANGVIIGMETYPAMVRDWGGLLHLLDRLCLWIFVVEILLKTIACGRRPWDFFRSSWNVFDFVIVAAAFLPGLEGQVTILRLVRLLRVLRLLTVLPGLQVLVMALLHSLPRIGQMALLACLLFYVYGVAGQTLFSSHDPEHWGTLHISLLSLFRTLTLEDWTDLMYTAMEAYPWAWLYFVSFVLLATFIIFNMLIGIILTSMEEAKERVLLEHLAPQELEVHERVKQIKAQLEELEKSLKRN